MRSHFMQAWTSATSFANRVCLVSASIIEFQVIVLFLLAGSGVMRRWTGTSRCLAAYQNDSRRTLGDASDRQNFRAPSENNHENDIRRTTKAHCRHCGET